jgi:hypothetical protein
MCEWLHKEGIAYDKHPHHVRYKFPGLVIAHVDCARVLPLRVAFASELLRYSQASLNYFLTNTNCRQHFNRIFAYLPVLLHKHLPVYLLFVLYVLLDPWQVNCTSEKGCKNPNFQDLVNHTLNLAQDEKGHNSK